MDDNWKNQVTTPALIVDYGILQQNIYYMANFAAECGVKLRPHVKTHKCPPVADMQIEAGAEGICVAKVSEAEVFAVNGIKDILITNEIIAPEKILRLLDLNRYTRTRVVVDSKQNIEDLNKLAEGRNQVLEVLIDINVGMNRTGVLPGQAALELAQLIAQSPNLKLCGLQAYEGHLTYIKDFAQKEERTRACMASVVETKELIENEGIICETITAGGSGTFMITAKCPGVTEIQPGTYVYNDHHINSFVPELLIALTVLTTVNNFPAQGIVTLDMGSKSMSSDMGMPLFKGYGKSMKVLALTEEHCQCTYGPKYEFHLGEKIEAIPAHVCTTVNLYDYFYIIDDGELTGRWDILARGKRE